MGEDLLGPASSLLTIAPVGRDELESGFFSRIFQMPRGCGARYLRLVHVSILGSLYWRSQAFERFITFFKSFSPALFFELPKDKALLSVSDHVEPC